MSRASQIDTHELFEQSVAALSGKHPTLRESLLNDFRVYADSEGRLLPSTFGRDSIFNEPYLAQRAGLRHIHLCLQPGGFNPNLVQYDRTTPPGCPEQDAFLIYARHEFYEGRYLILTLMQPDAHVQARNASIMKNLGYIAQAFQAE